MPLDVVYVPKSRDKYIEVYPSDDYSIIAKIGDNLDIDIKINEDIKFPLKELDKIGKMIIYKNGQAVDELNLVVHEEVKKERLFSAVFRYIRDLFSAISSKIVTG